MLVAIDNGHGLHTAGKRTPIFPDGTTSPLTKKNFMHEWEFNYAVAKMLEIELQKYSISSFLVSDTEMDTPLGVRSDKINRSKATISVSIHANANKGVWGTHGGIETYWLKRTDEALAKAVHPELIKATGLRDRGTKVGDLHMIREVKVPAILVECGFMDNLVEARLLLDNNYRKACAEAIAKGIANYFGISKKEEYKMKPEDANKIIQRFLKPMYGFVISDVDKKEIGRLADELRKASGQATQNS